MLLTEHYNLEGQSDDIIHWFGVVVSLLRIVDSKLVGGRDSVNIEVPRGNQVNANKIEIVNSQLEKSQRDCVSIGDYASACPPSYAKEPTHLTL